MKYLVLLGLAMSFALPTQAQHRLKKLSDDVNYLVNTYSQELVQKDRREVRMLLRDVKYVFESAGYYVDGNNGGWDIVRPLFCDTGNNKLIDGNGKEIHDFGNSRDCKEAKELILQGSHFCDTSDNTLYTPYGDLVHDFGNTKDCRGAIPRVNAGKPFCDFSDNTLRKANGDLIYDFGNSRDCQNALDDY